MDYYAHFTSNNMQNSMWRKDGNIMKKVFSAVLMFALLALPMTMLSAKEPSESELYPMVGNQFPSVINDVRLEAYLEAYEQQLFPGLEDDMLIVHEKGEGGGFLFSELTDAETTKKRHEELNGVECEIVTIKEAKEIYKQSLRQDLIEDYNE